MSEIYNHTAYSTPLLESMIERVMDYMEIDHKANVSDVRDMAVKFIYEAKKGRTLASAYNGRPHFDDLVGKAKKRFADRGYLIEKTCSVTGNPYTKWSATKSDNPFFIEIRLPRPDSLYVDLEKSVHRITASILGTICHELQHIIQFTKYDKHSSFFGYGHGRYTSKRTNYSTRPCEVEARRVQGEFVAYVYNTIDYEGLNNSYTADFAFEFDQVVNTYKGRKVL